MKRTIKRLALALAAVLLCFLMAGCEGSGEMGNIDMDGNVLDGPPSYSSDGRTVTQNYVVNEYDTRNYGATLAGQRVTRDEYGGVIEVSQAYAVTKYTYVFSAENALASLLTDFADTDEVQYFVLTYKYGVGYQFSYDPSELESIQFEYRNSNQQSIKIVYDGSFTIQNNTTLDSDVVYEMLEKILNQTVSNDTEFKTAITRLASRAFNSGKNLY